MANRKEDKQINFRVSADEYQRLEKMALDVGMSVSAFAKSEVLGIKTRTPKIPHDDALLIASELRKIGVNVNQIAKHLNNGLSVPMTHLNALQGVLKDIWQSLN